MNYNKTIYLCPPDDLELKYSINPWMELKTKFSREQASIQWKELVKIYRSLIPDRITIVPPKTGLTELCFIGDSVFLFDDKAIFSRFAAHERFSETDYVMNYFQKLGLNCVRIPEGMSYEGSGETLVWNNKVFVGYGQRSTVGIDKILKDFLGIEVIGLELTDPEYYHLDTAFLPINDKLIAIYEPAFSDDAKQEIKNLNCEILYLNEADAQAFALNSIVIGTNIIVHSGAVQFQNQMRDRGYTIHSIDISEFLKFGGGLKCLSLQHYM